MEKDSKDSDVFQKMVDEWPSAIIARTEVGRYSGGLLNPKTMANLDSLGQGPEKVVVGRKVAYATKAMAEWLRGRTN